MLAGERFREKGWWAGAHISVGTLLFSTPLFTTPHPLPQWGPASRAQSSPNGIQASLEKVWASPQPAGWQREPTGCQSWSTENVALGASRLRNHSEAGQLGNTPQGWGLGGGHRGVRALGVAPWQDGMWCPTLEAGTLSSLEGAFALGSQLGPSTTGCCPYPWSLGQEQQQEEEKTLAHLILEWHLPLAWSLQRPLPIRLNIT